MKLTKILIVATFFIFISCNTKIKNEKPTIAAFKGETSIDNLKLLKQHCYACHSITSKSHDEIIAPPMAAVKRRYLMSYNTEKEFIEAFTSWVLDPKEEHSLMRGAINNFNVMPKQPFKRWEIENIASYVFNNELEQPDWFESHFKKEHSNGMGNGRGNGKGNGLGKGVRN